MSECPANLQSCIFQGEVQHERLAPFPHRFRYRLFMMYLDLDELNDIFRGRWLWSNRRGAIASFCREDHLGNPAMPLKQAVRELVTDRLGHCPQGPIRLLTHLRYFGFAMNPVSFYYCYNADGRNIEAVVAEVNNTPWGEQHCYVLDWRNSDSCRELHLRQMKEFHVSPFMPMGMQYRWEIQAPGDTLSVQIDNFKDEEHVFGARLRLSRVEISTASLTRFLLWRPCMTASVFASIYWQALRLWWKGAAYFPHPRVPSPQTRSTSV